MASTRAAVCGPIVPAQVIPIIKLRAPVVAGEAVSSDDEREFLTAYSRLAVLVAPVTAATLRATTRHEQSRSLLGRILWFRSLSEAQLASSLLGFFAICLLLAIGVGEGERSLIAIIVSSQELLIKTREELQTGKLALQVFNEQIKALDVQASQSDPSRGIVRAGLVKQREELDLRLDRLRERQLGLEQAIANGYETMGRITPFVDWSTLRTIIIPVSSVIGGFVLPPIYGALGTCTYLLRSIYASMVNRSYDSRRSGEFIVRIFLGMLSGMTLQWLFVRDGTAVPGGITPAVLAFLGGYSVEFLFTAVDRLLALATGSLKTGAPTK